jgi:L-amino acid N-acyltransferase YncA
MKIYHKGACMSQIDIIDTNATNICDHPFCVGAQTGHPHKTAWLKKRFAEGLKFKVLRVDGEEAGFIEYVPGEMTWRPIEAAQYMVIHCIMLNKKAHKGRGYGSLLVREALSDAKKANMKGVAVVASGGTWMAGPGLFLRCGFECVDTAPSSFQLMAKKWGNPPSPRFKTGWERTLRRKYASGLTILRSDQCPYIAKSMPDILRACEEFEVQPRVVELRSARQAQNAPSAYGIFNIVYNGQVVADHPISATRFKNILRKLPPS